MTKQTQKTDQASDLGIEIQALAKSEIAARSKALKAAADSFTQELESDAFAARAKLVELVFDQWQANEPLSWEQHGQLCVALCDIRTRDGLLRRLHDATELRNQARDHLVREIARSHQDCTPPLATVFGGIAWLDGDGAITRVAVDRALELDPAYSLAQLLDIALRHNVPATVWSASLGAVSFDACLKGAA